MLAGARDTSKRRTIICIACAETEKTYAPSSTAKSAVAKPQNNGGNKMGCGGGCNKSTPSLLKQAFNAKESLAHWIKNGRQTVTAEQYEERGKICEACPHLKKSLLGLKCGECGCFVALKAGLNTQPGKSDCPQGRWPAIDAPEPVVAHRPAVKDRTPDRRVPESGKTLISIAKGLGDSMCFRSVLMHLKELRPDLQVAVHCNRWHVSALSDLCERVVDTPRLDGYIWRTAAFMRPKKCLTDIPSNTTQHYLLESCGLVPRRELSGYGRLPIAQDEFSAARQYLSSITSRQDDGRYRVVLVHQVGRSYPSAKNPRQSDWLPTIDHLKAMGYAIVAVNFDGNSEAAKSGLVQSLDQSNYSHPQHATSLAALIEQSSLFIGVDSGPLHVAGSCTTPSIGVWLNHHPVHSYNLADNVTHLVPTQHADYVPRENCQQGLEFFGLHYNHRVYRKLNDAMPLLAEELLAGGELVMHRDVWLRRKYVEQDWFIANEILQDDYRVRSLGWTPSTVIDVGAHCGFFSRQAAELWPNASIVAVEPVSENALAARKNCPKATVIQAACTYDPEPIRLRVTIDDQQHTGGSHVSPTGERIVPRVTLDELLSGIEGGDVLLKLDAEGAEFSLLEHCQQLSKVRTIVGESHGHSKVVELVRRKWPDWKLTVYRDAETGLFRLDRP